MKGKILRLFYKKCTACGCGRMVKGICDKCGEAYYEATRPQLPLRTRIWLFLIPHFALYWYTQIKWKIKLRGGK